MPSTEKFIGNFAYQAEATPKGFRKPQIVDLYGQTEYAIPKVEASEVKPAAVRVLEHGSEDLPHLHVRLTGWGGRLWRPASSVVGTPLGHYKLRFQGTWPRAEKGDFLKHLPPGSLTDPYLTSIDFDYAVRGTHGGTDTPIGTYDENFFEGTVARSNRGDALRRKEAAARHVLIVGDEVYFSACDPVWSCLMTKAGDKVSFNIRLACPVPHNNQMPYYPRRSANDQMMQQGCNFRLDRLEDAKSWIRATYGDVSITVQGKVEAMDAAYLSQDDVAMTLRERIPQVLSYADSCALQFSEAGTAAWKTLSIAGRSITRHDNGLIDGECDRLIAALRVLKHDCETRLSKPSDRYVVQTTARLAAETLQRIDFELGLRRGLGPDDEDALSALPGAA